MQPGQFPGANNTSQAWIEFWDTLSRAVRHVTELDAVAQSSPDGDGVNAADTNVIHIATHDEQHLALLEQLYVAGALAKAEFDYANELFQWSDPRIRSILSTFDRDANVVQLLVGVLVCRLFIPSLLTPLRLLAFRL
jgi:hypothetical protein